VVWKSKIVPITMRKLRGYVVYKIEKVIDNLCISVNYTNHKQTLSQTQLC